MLLLLRNLSLNAYAQYYKDFNDNHHFDIMGGYEWQHFWKSTNSDYVGRYPMTNDDPTLAGTDNQEYSSQYQHVYFRSDTTRTGKYLQYDTS